jgi:hypothetical protein
MTVPSPLTVETPGPGTFNVIDLVGSLTFVRVTFRAPVTSVAPIDLDGRDVSAN